MTVTGPCYARPATPAVRFMSISTVFPVVIDTDYWIQTTVTYVGHNAGTVLIL